MKTLSDNYFNSMAQEIEAQAAALQKARDEVELRVHERTAELAAPLSLPESPTRVCSSAK